MVQFAAEHGFCARIQEFHEASEFQYLIKVIYSL